MRTLSSAGNPSSPSGDTSPSLSMSGAASSTSHTFMSNPAAPPCRQFLPSFCGSLNSLPPSEKRAFAILLPKRPMVAPKNLSPVKLAYFSRVACPRTTSAKSPFLSGAKSSTTRAPKFVTDISMPFSFRRMNSPVFLEPISDSKAAGSTFEKRFFMGDI